MNDGVVEKVDNILNTIKIIQSCCVVCITQHDACLLPEHEDISCTQKSISCLLLILLWLPCAL